VLDADPELGSGLGAARFATARREARALVMNLDKGDWDQPTWSAGLRGGPGLLVLDGLLLRSVGMDGRYGAEMLGAGDLLRPWQHEDAFASVPRQSQLRALQRSRLALLDIDFLRRVAPFPEISGQLVARALLRSRQLAVNMAIVHQPRVETRLHMLLWQMADRWGSVGRDGVFVPIELTHTILAELVAARRPTVSAALRALEHENAIERLAGGWQLHGLPPGELQAVNLVGVRKKGRGQPPRARPAGDQHR
jgi:CRP-like cAMP-binding protein